MGYRSDQAGALPSMRESDKSFGFRVRDFTVGLGIEGFRVLGWGFRVCLH